MGSRIKVYVAQMSQDTSGNRRVQLRSDYDTANVAEDAAFAAAVPSIVIQAQLADATLLSALAPGAFFYIDLTLTLVPAAQVPAPMQPIAPGAPPAAAT